MIRPTWWSVYSENPAKTSAVRANSRFSSSDSESQGRTTSLGLNVPSGIGFRGVSSVPSGMMPFSTMRPRTHSR
jgi:hypothetical protein